MISHYDLDVIVIGTGPGGSTAGLEASKVGKRVAALESSSSR